LRDGELVAMAGERIAIPGMREISAVCTHPDHTGNGFATALIKQLLRFHAEHGLQSFLHVAEQNKRAINLYEHLGFVTTAAVHFREMRRLSR
jgi:predicted GNAT family acetyltransferase